MKCMQYIRVTPLLLGLMLGATATFGAASSTNFKIDSDQIDAGGDVATSTNFKLEGTIGQFVTGSLESASFTTSSGGAAGSSGGSSGENQVTPVVSTLYFAYEDYGTALGFSEGITPSLTTTTIYVYGTVVDQNGAGTITNVTSTLYRSSLGETCTPDIFSCYQPATACSITPITATASHYACQYDISAYADATDTVGTYPSEYWTARVAVFDTSNFTSYTTNDIEMNSVAAFTLATSTIAFDQMTLGATTTASTSKSIELLQAGNIAADIMLSSFQNLTCSQAGFIPKENLKWSIYNVDYTHASSTSFSSTPVRAFLNVPRKIDSITPTGTTFFNLGIPEQGLGGTCTGAIILNMIPAQ